MSDHPRSMKHLLGELGGKIGLPSAVQTGVIWQKWRTIVGEAIAEHAEPTSLRDGVLRVRADSPAWATEIGYLARHIVSRANDVAGSAVVREMKVWTGPGKVAGEPPRAPGSISTEQPSKTPHKDPLEAFEAARAAWRKRGGRGGGRPS